MIKAPQLLGAGSDPPSSAPFLALVDDRVTPGRAASPSYRLQIDYKPPASTARDFKVPRMSLLNSRTSSLSRSERVRLLPHEHSNSMRCSERQSSSRPRSISRSPQPHSRTMRPEDSRECSSGFAELSTFPLPLSSRRDLPAAWRG